MDITTTTGATIPTPSLATSSRRRLVLLPYPLQGHINPMLQLASILHSKGFSITILHTRFNAPDPTNHPHFNFMPIPGVAEENLPVSGTDNLIRLMRYLNDEGLGPIRGCLEKLLSEDAGVASLITDAQWFAVQTIADGLELPRIVNWTTSVSAFLSFSAVPILRQMGYFRRLSDGIYNSLKQSYLIKSHL
ncbi:putative cytokinin 7-beta-glucosyltransferase [Helianthus annuus]|nr:putative cytokinin 7-beta-glucosyltransferase [Helianthus annuus]KAJ0707008.1 putative cytokinin 7-beta-glucosyltransferase [Helianthus annuus]KAJ0711033.1 putative cytokinin 7-beta-glucosyltransferase [Helianthus annuus]KAJ0752966.1 putative cytokinin 7-beta-glucosyltransferase [Helianthus annuus]